MEPTVGDARGRGRRPRRPPAAPRCDSPAPASTADAAGRFRLLDVEGPMARSDLPDAPGVSAAEVELVRIHFADLIDAVLRGGA